MAARMIVCCLALAAALAALPESVGQSAEKSSAATAPPLTPALRLAVRFLLRQQQRDGSWSENADGGPSSAAHTSLAILALMRTGCHPRNGPCAVQLERGIRSVCSEIENSAKNSLFLSPRKQAIHRYLGRPVDLVLALNMLVEVKGQMADEKDEQRVKAAASAIVAKLKAQQRSDGTWLADGSTPEVTHALIIKALHRARHAGFDGDRGAIDRAIQAYARPGAFPNPLSLGSSLNSDAIVLSIWSDALGGVQRDIERARAAVTAASGEASIKTANHLDYLEKTERQFKKTIADILQKIEWKTHLQNATTAGGENLISYLFMSELLLTIGAQGDPDWDKRLAAVLERQQNGDGSWSGNHCGAGKNFCTSLVVLLLLADRCPAVQEAHRRETAAAERNRRTAAPPSMLDAISPGSK